MPVSVDLRRITLLSLVAIATGLTGCSMFKEHATPKLAAEVTPGPEHHGAPTAKYTVELRPEKGKPQTVEKPLTETLHVQAALQATGAAKKFERATVDVYRPLPAGGWHKMTLEFDHDAKAVPPEYDYAVLPGDRIVVTEDTRTVFDDVMEKSLKPFGFTPPKKKDAIKERYQVQG